ncbi:MAG TPA: alpha/beta hydrolase domain-containing protein [Actinoallomurus sp.]
MAVAAGLAVSPRPPQLDLDRRVGSHCPTARRANSFCVLYGTHRDFTKAQLDALYHGDRDYRRQVADDVRRIEGQGFLLPEDGQVFIDAARHRHV